MATASGQLTQVLQKMHITLPVFYDYTWKLLVLNENELEVEQNKKDVFGSEYIYTYGFKPLTK